MAIIAISLRAKRFNMDSPDTLEPGVSRRRLLGQSGGATRVDVEPCSRGFVFLGRPFYGRWTPPLKLRQPVSNGLPSEPLKSKVTPIIPHRMDFSWYLRKPVERADNTLWGGVKPASRLSADPALTSSEWSRLLRQAATSR